MKWIDVNDRLPDSQDIEEYVESEGYADYLMVNVERYGWMKAMYINGNWWKDHTSKIALKVTHWMRISNPLKS